jgi:hypothetical protein
MSTPTNTAKPAKTTIPASSVFVATPGNSTGGEPVAYVPFPADIVDTTVVGRLASSTREEEGEVMLVMYTSVSEVGIATAVSEGMAMDPVWLTSETVSEYA